MKALLPVYCRPLGYVILVFALFIPFILVMMGKVTDTNLLFYKECTKLLMIVGALMIIFALSKSESRETEQIRNSATRNAIFLTVLFVFGGKTITEKHGMIGISVFYTAVVMILGAVFIVLTIGIIKGYANSDGKTVAEKKQ